MPYRQVTFHEPDFPLLVIPLNPQEPTALHCHEFEELTIIRSGSGQHLYEGKLYPVGAGDVYTIKPGMEHGYPTAEDLQLVNIIYVSSKLHLNAEDLDEIDGYHVLFDLEPKFRSQTQFQSRLRLNPVQLGNLLSMVESLRSELWNPKPGKRFMALTEFRRIIGYLSRCYSEVQDKNVHSLLVLSKAIRYMEEHFREGVSIPELASYASVSESTLLRAFKKNTKTSPNEYLLQLRIRHACERLRGNNDTISDIAFELGYTDSNYFSRQFRQLMGQTPREYRRQT